MNKWQPSETALTNTSILAYIPNAEHYGPGIYRALLVDMGTGRHWSVSGLYMGRDCGPGYQPTHWMPLPEAPGVTESNAGCKSHDLNLVDECARCRFIKLYRTPKAEINTPCPLISFQVGRDGIDDYIDLRIEVLNYTGREQGGCHDEILGPSVELGRAFVASTGEPFELTDREMESARDAAIEQIEKPE